MVDFHWSISVSVVRFGEKPQSFLFSLSKWALKARDLLSPEFPLPMSHSIPRNKIAPQDPFLLRFLHHLVVESVLDLWTGPPTVGLLEPRPPLEPHSTQTASGTPGIVEMLRRPRNHRQGLQAEPWLRKPCWSLHILCQAMGISCFKYQVTRTMIEPVNLMHEMIDINYIDFRSDFTCSILQTLLAPKTQCMATNFSGSVGGKCGKRMQSFMHRLRRILQAAQGILVPAAADSISMRAARGIVFQHWVVVSELNGLVFISQ